MQAIRGRVWILGLVVRLFAVAASLTWLAATAFPATPARLEEQAAAASAASQPEQAASYLRDLVAYFPGMDNFRLDLIHAEIAAGDFDAAQHDLSALAEMRLLSGDELLLWGTIYDGQGRHEAAVAAWEDAWAAGLADSLILTNLSYHYLEKQDWQEALRALDALSALGTSDTHLLYRYGLLQAFYSPSSAVTALAQYAALAPDDAGKLVPLLDALDDAERVEPALFNTRLGVAYLALSEYTLADWALQRAVDYNPSYGEALAYLAYTRSQLGGVPVGMAEQARVLSPNNPVVHYLAGVVWQLADSPQTARIALERALELDRENPVIAVEIANTHRRENQFALAELWMQEAVKLSGDDAKYRLLLAQFYVDEEYLAAEQGLPLALALVEDFPESAEAHTTLGWAYFLSGDPARADEELQQALTLNPDLARANAYRGAFLESQGRAVEAIDYYTRAADLDPRGPFGAMGRRALERILGKNG